MFLYTLHWIFIAFHFKKKKIVGFLDLLEVMGGGSKVVEAPRRSSFMVVVVVATHLLLMLIRLLGLDRLLPVLLLLMMSLFVVNGRLGDGPSEKPVHWRGRRQAQQWIENVVQRGNTRGGRWDPFGLQQRRRLWRSRIISVHNRQRPSSIAWPCWSKHTPNTHSQGSNYKS